MIKPGIITPDSLKIIKQRIQIACEKSGRDIENIKIIAVTKTFGIEAINSALSLGINCIGENKVQELEFKSPQILDKSNKEIHFIGHIQSNKVRKIIKLADVIQTVDSLKLASRINNISKELNKKTTIYIQINTAKDDKKFGFYPKEVLNVSKAIIKMKNLNFIGIMTIPPMSKDYDLLKTIFNKTRKIKDDIQNQINPKCKYLSMGMSNDFETAIGCGATHIRLGTILFGNRVVKN
tara:strand:- start:1194 stop:1904 length:711 start_codon:yes stop_codon:yes gene_type:complete